MVDHRGVARLLLAGRTYREIVAAAKVSQRDVARVKRVIEEHGLTTASLDRVTDADLAALFPDGRARVSAGYDAPDFRGVVASMKRNRHYTVLAAWRRYVEVPAAGRKYGYAQYCHLFSEYVAGNDLVATLRHEPGRTALIDWAGDTLAVVDQVTGQTSKAYLLVVTLPYSGLMFVRAYLDMKMEAWLDGHIRALEYFGGCDRQATPPSSCPGRRARTSMFVRAYLDMKMEAWLDGHIRALEYFGGVPAILVPDNAATATHIKTKGDPARFVTERYQQFADHYGCSIVPARVRRPRDKASAESSVNVSYKRIYGYLAEETWGSITELNDAIAERLAEINDELRRRDGSTRRERFDAEEAQALGPLPAERFEEVEWRTAKVQRNYHVTCESQHYSVPYQLAGQLLRVRITASAVTVFDGTVVVASHPRKTGRKGQYSTNKEHVPPAHREIHGLWSRSWFIDRARRIGPATEQVITQAIDRKQIEAQAYQDCQNILTHLAKKGHARLEAACQQVLNMRATPTYSTIARMMAAITSDTDKPATPTAAPSTRKPDAAHHDDGSGAPPGAFIRGADYYRQGW